MRAIPRKLLPMNLCTNGKAAANKILCLANCKNNGMPSCYFPYCKTMPYEKSSRLVNQVCLYEFTASSSANRPMLLVLLPTHRAQEDLEGYLLMI